MWVRTASKRDVPAISRLLGLVWHHTYDSIYGAKRVEEITREWHSVEALEKKLNAPAAEFLIADDGNAITAMAYASRTSDSQAKLHQLYVLPDYQGRGVGRMLLDEIEESFCEVRELVLEVEEQNVTAIRFYEKNGFQQSGRTGNCCTQGSGIPALLYTKTRS